MASICGWFVAVAAELPKRLVPGLWYCSALFGYCGRRTVRLLVGAVVIFVIVMRGIAGVSNFVGLGVAILHAKYYWVGKRLVRCSVCHTVFAVVGCVVCVSCRGSDCVCQNLNCQQASPDSGLTSSLLRCTGYAPWSRLSASQSANKVCACPRKLSS